MTAKQLWKALASFSERGPIRDLWSANGALTPDGPEEVLVAVFWFDGGLRAVFDPRVPPEDRTGLLALAEQWRRAADEGLEELTGRSQKCN